MLGVLRTPDVYGNLPIDLAIRAGSVEAFETIDELTLKDIGDMDLVGHIRKQTRKTLSDHTAHTLEVRDVADALFTILNQFSTTTKLSPSSLATTKTREVPQGFDQYAARLTCAQSTQALDSLNYDSFGFSNGVFGAFDESSVAVDSNGNTVLHIAALTGNMAALKIFLAHMSQVLHRQLRNSNTNLDENEKIKIFEAAVAWLGYSNKQGFTFYDIFEAQVLKLEKMLNWAWLDTKKGDPRLLEVHNPHHKSGLQKIKTRSAYLFEADERARLTEEFQKCTQLLS